MAVERFKTVAIVGAETPIGRELRDQLKERKVAREIQSIGAEDEISGILTEVEGEPVVMTPLDADRLQGSQVVFCGGSPKSTLRAFQLLQETQAATKIIDLTYALEEQPAARLRAPFLEKDDPQLPDDAVHVLAHPAAVTAAAVLTRLHKRHPIARAVVQIFEPVSERGQIGMNELQQQTTALLTFQTLNKKVFDTQAAFAVLPRYGEDAADKLEEIELKIDRHLASLLAPYGVPMPSLRLAQAPVFHGYTLSFWIELEARQSAQEVGEALASAHIEVRESDLEAPTNVGSVGQSGVTVGMIEADRHNPRALWLWAVADNYRLLIDNAIAVTATLDKGTTA